MAKMTDRTPDAYRAHGFVISEMQALRRKYGLTHLIALGYGSRTKTELVATVGGTAEEGDQACRTGNKIKKPTAGPSPCATTRSAGWPA